MKPVLICALSMVALAVFSFSTPFPRGGRIGQINSAAVVH